MAKIPLDRARPGHRVTRALTNANGIVLVQPGTELTAALIERLKVIGIDTVFVADDGKAASRRVHEALRDLERRFSGHEHDTLMMQIKDVVADHLRRVASSADAPPSSHA